MRTFNLVPRSFFSVALLVLVFYLTTRIQAVDQDPAANRGRLTELQQERRDVLKTRVELVEALFKNARSTYEEVTAARDDLWVAEYELATNKAQRTDIMKRRIENAREFETIMKQRKKDARATEADILLATSRRLRLEIELLQQSEPIEMKR